MESVEGTSKIHIVFDGPPSHRSGRFVEVEDDAGASISVGEWQEHVCGYWHLVIDDPRALSAAEAKVKELEGETARLREACEELIDAGMAPMTRDCGVAWTARVQAAARKAQTLVAALSFSPPQPDTSPDAYVKALEDVAKAARDVEDRSAVMAYPFEALRASLARLDALKGGKP